MTLKDRLLQADLIIQGEVIDIQHRNSSVGNSDHVSLPHAFVTLAVEKVFKGQPSTKDTFTLRVEGGPDGKGRVLVVGGVPMFDVGAREILFVRDNGEDICPLVGWDQGRLRLVGGDVFDSLGHEVWILPDGDLGIGMAAIDVDQFPYPALQPGETGAGFDFSPPEGSLHPDARGFAAIIESRLLALKKSGEMLEPPVVRSEDPDRPFFVQALKAQKPPELVPGMGEPGLAKTPRTADELEAELLRLSGGDPTLSTLKQKKPSRPGKAPRKRSTKK